MPFRPSTEDLSLLPGRAASEGLSQAAQRRLRWLVYYWEHGRSLWDASVEFGISPTTLKRWLKRFDPDDLSTLEDRSHCPHTLRRPAVEHAVIALVRGYRVRYPRLGKGPIAERLLREHGVVLSPSGVGRVIERECLYFAATPHHRKKRLLCQGWVPHRPAGPAGGPQDSARPPLPESLWHRNQHLGARRPAAPPALLALLGASILVNLLLVARLLTHAHGM